VGWGDGWLRNGEEGCCCVGFVAWEGMRFSHAWVNTGTPEDELESVPCADVDGLDVSNGNRPITYPGFTPDISFGREREYQCLTDMKYQPTIPTLEPSNFLFVAR